MIKYLLKNILSINNIFEHYDIIIMKYQFVTD